MIQNPKNNFFIKNKIDIFIFIQYLALVTYTLRMFLKIWNVSSVTFDDIEKDNIFETITNGRKACILADKKDETTPIVRSTTQYTHPDKDFNSIYYNIVDNLKSKTALDIYFNNAMVEIYDDYYTKMKYHTDQTLDLDDDSYIGIYSLYKNEEVKDSEKRVLKIKDRKTNKINEILMDHNSLILFSSEINKKFLHKIILPNGKSGNKWMGITFRKSKSFVRFIDNEPYLNGVKLHLASEEERKKFYNMRSRENKDMKFEYPDINYTLSETDVIKKGASQ
jgi:hypothetical protein